MNKENFIAKILSAKGVDADGELVLFIDQNLQPVIERVARQVAAIKPSGHEQLLTTVTISFTDELGDVLGFPAVSLRTLFPRIIFDPAKKLYEVSILVDDSFVRVEPVNSVTALSLSERHNKFYYYIKEPYILIAQREEDEFDVDITTDLKLTHYIIPTIETFPDSLESFLLEAFYELLGIRNENQK